MATSEVQANRAALIRSRAGSYSGLVAAAILAVAMGVGLNLAIFNGSLQNFGAGGPEFARAASESDSESDINKVACLPASALGDQGSEGEAIIKSAVSRTASTYPRRARLKTVWNRSTGLAPRSKPCSFVTGDFIRSLIFHLATEAAIDRMRGRISSLFFTMTVAGRGKVDLPGE